jgi:predicted O-methyltransferase YrrM
MLMSPFDQRSAWKGLQWRYLELLKDVNPVRMIVQIGVDYGFSLLRLASDFTQARVIGVESFGPCAQHADAEQCVVEKLREVPNAALWKMTSREASRKWMVDGYPKIDILHLDALHDYESVRDYFDAWEPLVVEGGVIMFQHVTSFFEDTGRFFLQLEGRKSLIPEHGLGFWYKDHDWKDSLLF